VALASGSGTTLQALLDGAQPRAPASPYQVVAAVVNKRGAGAIERAHAAGVLCEVVAHKDFATRADFERASLDAIAPYEADLIALAGFMRILTPVFLGGAGIPVLNVHPSILPAFPGVDAPRQAIAAGAQVSGCSVHLVDAGVDTGALLAQRQVPVLPGDDAASLHLRIQAQERAAYVEVLNAVGRGESLPR